MMEKMIMLNLFSILHRVVSRLLLISSNKESFLIGARIWEHEAVLVHQ